MAQSGTTINLYINGNNVGQGLNFKTLRPFTRLFNMIGRDNSNSLLDADMVIDDLKIFNRSLTQQEVLYVMNSFNTYQTKGPVRNTATKNSFIASNIPGLSANEAIFSNSQQYMAEMRWDGNFVVYVSLKK